MVSELHQGAWKRNKRCCCTNHNKSKLCLKIVDLNLGIHDVENFVLMISDYIRISLLVNVSLQIIPTYFKMSQLFTTFSLSLTVLL